MKNLILITFLLCLTFFNYSQVCADCGALYENRQYDKVIEKIATSQDSLHIEDLVLLAKSYQHLGMKKDAIGAYSHILMTDENNIDALVSVGALFIEMEQYENALFATNKVLQLDSKNSNAIYNKAVCYYYQKDEDKLNFYCEEVLKSNPKNIDLRFVLAMKQMEKQDFTAASKTLEELHGLNSKYENSNFHFAYCKYKLKEFDSAKKYFLKAIELSDEQIIDAYYYLAQIYKSEDKKVEACDAFTNAINLGDITITKEADDYCLEKKKSKIKLFDRGFRPSF